MKRLRIAFTALVVILLFIMGYFLYENAGLIVRNKSAGKLLNPRAEISLKAPHFVEMDGEQKVLEVDAEEAYYFREDNMVELKGPMVVFYGKEGERTLISGESGRIDRSSNDMEVSGNVRVDSSGGYHFEAPSVRYSREDMTFSTDDIVRITGDGFDIRGVGMKADIERERFYLFSGVEAIFHSSFEGGASGRSHER